VWAGNSVVGRLVAGHIPPLLFNALRWACALALLLPFAWRTFAAPARRAEIAARWRHLALLGLFGVAVYNAMQYMALRTSSPLNVTLIAASSPLWMMATGALLYRVRPTQRDLIAAALSLIGVVVVLTRGDPLALAQLQFVPGDLMMLVAIGCWSIYSWMLARPPLSMRGSTRPSWNWAEFIAVQAAFGIVWATAAAAAESVVLAGSEPVQWSWLVVLALAYVAIFPSLVAYRAWGAGVARAGPAMASLFSNLTPLFTALISGAVLGLWPQAFHLVAFALILAAIAVSARR
jgi:drug/metabolite transporter (DMT)-like permease